MVLATICLSSASYAQQFIGISGGFSKGKFFDFTTDKYYDAKYLLHNGANFSSFYETKFDSSKSLKIELQYKYQKADLEIHNNFGHGSYYKNLSYSFQLLDIGCIYSLRLIKKPLELYFSFGPTLSYNIKTTSIGNGWNFVSLSQIDTNGNPVSMLTTRNWEINESHSNDLSLINLGFDAGFDFIVPINNVFDFIFQNRYNLFITNATKIYVLNYTSLITGNLKFGLRYNL